MNKTEIKKKLDLFRMDINGGDISWQIELIDLLEEIFVNNDERQHQDVRRTKHRYFTTRE